MPPFVFVNLIRGSSTVIKISPNMAAKIPSDVKMKTSPITMVLFDALIESINILPIPGKAKTVSVSVAPEITPIIDVGIPDTNGTIAFLKMCFLKSHVLTIL